MNKGLLKIALLSMVCASMPAAITSCKDYDDDITTLESQDKNLASQIAAIDEKVASLRAVAEEARNTANQALQDAAAAKAAGDDALAAAKEAKAEAELAKQAAATAKAEALAEIKALLESYAKVEVTDALQAEINKINERLKAIDETLANLPTGGGETTNYDEAIQALQTQLDALNIYKDLLANLAGKEDFINSLQQTITVINSAIADLQNQTSGFDSTLQAISERVAALEGNLVTINGDELRSLVFNPVFYYHGIEAMWANTWGYVDLAVKKVDANGEYATDAPVAGDSVFMTPALKATYHMNPSTAVMPQNVAAYSFTNTIKNAEFVRSAGFPVPTITAAEVNGGKVTVTANLKDGDKFPYIATDGKVTVLALQVNLGDTVITSDYAALKPIYTYGFALADATKPNHEPHLYTTMQQAMENEPQFEVAWNSPGVNIAEWVSTHYNTDASRAAGNDLKWDENATWQTVRDDGFDYSYELVGYHLGDNQTSESAHAALEVNGNNCTLRPQMTKDGMQQAFGYAQGMSTIDRMPIVRVVLKDVVSGKNAAVGYIKVLIVPDTKEDEVTVIDPFVFEDGYAAQCPLQSFERELTWWQVEERIIEKLGISKQEFEEQYEPDYESPLKYFPGHSTSKEAFILKQFNQAGAGARALAPNDTVGVVGKTEYDQAAAETEVIKWNISRDKAYKLFVEQRETSTKVIVRFVKTYTVSMGSNHTQTVHHYVYVTLTWTPKPLNVDPVGELKNDLKIPEMWYQAWTNQHGGFDETHLNVAVPEIGSTNPNQCTYVSHLLYPWVNEMKMAVTGVNPVYVGYDDVNLTKYFNFDPTLDPQDVVGISGAKYKLTAVGTTLYAALQATPTLTKPIAVISNNTASYTTWGTDDPQITYQENEYAKDLLNIFSHKRLAKNQTLTGKIIITAFNKCDKPLELKNNTYNVRFLRPVNMDVKQDAEMVDARNSGSVIDLADYISFTDWRSDDPESFFSTHANYYPYYGLKSIVVGFINPANPAQLIGANQYEPAVTSGSLRGVITTTLAGGTLAEKVPSLLACAPDPDSEKEVVTLDYNTGKHLAAVTPNMDLVYTPATGALGPGNLGKLTYYNNGENLNKDFELRVPLVLIYKWGYLTGYLDITVKPTLGQNF